MKSNRLERVNSEIQKEVALIINNELRDPQITSMIGVSEVDVAPDLANAKVYLIGPQYETEIPVKHINNISTILSTAI